MSITSVDWSKYGVKDAAKKGHDNNTSVDWSKYESAPSTPYKQTVSDLERNAARADQNLSPAASANVRSGIDAQAADYQAKYDKLPKFRKLIVDAVNSPIGKKIMGVEKVQSDFLRGSLRTASLGATDAADKALLNSNLSSPSDKAHLQARIDSSKTSTAGKVGEYAGYLVPGSASERASAALLKPLLKNAPKVVAGLTRGVGAGALFGMADETGQALTGQNDQTLGQRAIDVGVNTVLGGGLGGLGSAAGAGIQRGLQSLKGTLEGMQGNQLKAITAAMGKEYSSKLAAPGALKQLDEAMTKIKPIVEERLTPPLENQNELAKWVQQHIGIDNISLNEIRKMPYESLRQLAEEIRPNINVATEAHKAAAQLGYDLPSLLDGKANTLGRQVAQQASERAYGIYPGQLPNIRRPLTRGIASSEVAAAREPLPHAPQADETPLVSKEIQSFAPQEFKDISGFSAQTRDLYRNMEHALGDHAKPYLDAFNGAKKDNIVMQEYWVNRLKTEVVDKLGIKKDSKLSALTQKFGEKQITLDELKQQAPKDWEKVVEADKWFRQSYDHLIDIVNESRSKVYPGNPDKIVPKRSDYYRHFRELNGLEGLKNLFDTPAGIDPSLAGISEFTKPKSKFASIMQKRGMGPFKNDAVGGFLNYIPAATYATHIDPQISNFRSLAAALSDTTGESKNMNTFIEYLHDFSNDLSGKTNPADRFVQKIIPGGRKTMAAISWLSNRVKSNVILGNLGSTLAQTANIPNGIAFAKQHSIEGAGRALASIFKESEPMKESGFLKERFAADMYSKFDTNWLTLGNPLHIKKFAGWLMETSDKVGTNFVWNSAYAKGLAQKVADPVAYADDAARKLLAGRGIGEVPLLQKARVTQLIMPFQLEVANLWRVMGDFVGKKDFGGLATLFVANYLFNRGMEKVKGSGVTFDPIQAMIEAFGTPDLSPQQRGGRLAGELFSNLPGGQSIAGAMPEYGGTVLGVNVPSRKQLFGDNDPTRFGSGLPIVKGIQDPLHMIVPGFGGNQIKKTTQAVDTLRKGGSYTPDGKLKFPVKGSMAKAAQMLMFGPNATKEAQQYYKNDGRPLSATDTAAYQQSANKPELLKGIQQRRGLDKLKKQITDVQKDKNLSDPKKLAKIEPLMVKLRKMAGE